MSPVPGTVYAPAKKSIFSEMLANTKPVSVAELFEEIRRLRSDIADLRAHLSPASSVLITGRQAVEEFRRMK